MSNKRYILNYRWISIEYNALIKLLQYFVFSSLAILCGYLSHNKIDNIVNAFILISILPTLYIFNFFYYMIYRYTIKHILPQLKLFDSANRINILQSHFIILNLIITYLFYGHMFKRVSFLHYSPVVVAIFAIYSLMYFLHRSMKDIDTFLSKYSEHTLVSFLKYKAHEHAHVLAGSIIAMPFYVGASISYERVSIKSGMTDTIFAYLLFLFSWLVFYQHKYKNTYLDSYKYVYSMSLYPLFPILFYVTYVQDMNKFIILFSAVMIMYFLPYLYTMLNYKSKLTCVTNEKVVLAITMLILIDILSNNTSTIDTVTMPDSIDYGYDGAAALFSIVTGYITINKNANNNHSKLSKYLRTYLFLPLMTVSGTHLLLYLAIITDSLDRISKFAVILLNNKLTVVEISYIGILLILSFYITVINDDKKANDDNCNDA